MEPEEDEKPTYAVGYGQPPREHQFKPGQSGNKKGRPKGAASIERMVKEELARVVPLRASDKVVNLSLERAIVRRAVLDAATGKNSAAINRGLRLVERYGPKENVSPWNLSRLSDDELDVFEALLGKISDDETGAD